MIKAFKTLCLALALCAALCSCQLAIGNNGAQEDAVFCGYYITLEENEFPSLERIYGTMQTDANGAQDYVFEGISGIPYFTVTITDAGETYIRTISDDSVFESKMAYRVTDTGSSRDLSATIYLAAEKYVCFNPVYQAADGRVYIEHGSSMFFDPTLGSGTSMQASETVTLSENGQKKSSTVSIDVSICSVDRIEKTVIKQFDASDRVIGTQTILADSAPDTIRILPDTQYIIAEEHGKAISRTMVDLTAPDAFYTCRFIGKNDVAYGKNDLF